MMLKKYLWVVAVILLVGIYYFFNPMGSVLFPKCPFLTFTGLQCPGCGSQRAIHQLLHLNFIQAFRYNALLVLLLPIVALLFAVSANPTRHPKLYTRLHHPFVILLLFITIAGWTVLRNILGC